jgi:octaprenyl-diphosphate synthase
MLASTARAGALPQQQAGRALLDLLEPIAEQLPRLEQALAEQVRGFDRRLSEYVQYVLGASGKRLRPSLVLLAAGATGRIDERHIRVGVIIELIHVATLVHDDVLDEAGLRHELPTSNSRWGNELSVLLGDCLFAHALRLAAEFPTPEVCRRISEATNVVCSGEIIQTQRRFDLDLGVEEYLEIIGMKTGALFAVSSELGASLNGTDPATVKALADFGMHLGIAYQIYDDCVDLFGQERLAGKSLGTDVKKGKLTLPFLLLLRQLKNADRQQLGAAIFRDEPREQQRLLSLITANGALSESLAMIHSYLARAETCLAAVPQNVYTETMAAVSAYLARQSRLLLETGRAEQ